MLHEVHKTGNLTQMMIVKVLNCVVSAGIANALDLTDRILPRLQARPHCRPLLLNFPPYSREELAAIVQDRLAQVNAERKINPQRSLSFTFADFIMRLLF